ncbi:MAG: amylo-alpha-1,6-glucosidase [Phormidesmis sp.]
MFKPDQFVVERTVADKPGKAVIAGYPWFGDWGRDTMIALPGRKQLLKAH